MDTRKLLDNVLKLNPEDIALAHDVINYQLRKKLLKKEDSPGVKLDSISRNIPASMREIMSQIIALSKQLQVKDNTTDTQLAALLNLLPTARMRSSLFHDQNLNKTIELLGYSVQAKLAALKELFLEIPDLTKLFSPPLDLLIKAITLKRRQVFNQENDPDLVEEDLSFNIIKFNLDNQLQRLAYSNAMMRVSICIDACVTFKIKLLKEIIDEVRDEFPGIYNQYIRNGNKFDLDAFIATIINKNSPLANSKSDLLDVLLDKYRLTTDLQNITLNRNLTVHEQLQQFDDLFDKHIAFLQQNHDTFAKAFLKVAGSILTMGIATTFIWSTTTSETFVTKIQNQLPKSPNY